MSVINTYSLFYYGTTIDSTKVALDFSENGGSEIQATLTVGGYSPTDLAIHIQERMNLASTASGNGWTYSVEILRATRQIRVSTSDGNFELLSNSGSRVSSGVWNTIGFDTGSDKTGSNSYDSTLGVGSEYRPQSLFRDYIAPDHYRVKEKAVVNVNASGNNVQSVYYGDTQFIQANISLITNKAGPFIGVNMEAQTNGVENALELLNFIITKGTFEIMPDRNTPENFYKVICERTPRSSKGTEFQLERMRAADFYETGPILMRVIS